MTFNPKDHLISMGAKGEYLEVKWRILWARDERPNIGIHTELIATEPMAIFKATIVSEDGAILSTGYGSAPLAGAKVYTGKGLEKAETAAIGRALAHAGYGTQFAPDDDEEVDTVVDAPVQRKQQPSPTTPATPKNAANSPSNANPVWFDVAVGEAWKDIKDYLLNTKVYANEFEMKNSMAKRGVVADNKIAEEWKHKLASELVTFLKTRHEEKQPA